MRRNPSRPGLSYFDANKGRLITEGPDVLNVKQEILARWGDVLEIFFDTWDEVWVIVEKCKDGTDRLVHKTKRLDMTVVEKLAKIDAAAHAQPDLNRQYELDDEKAEKDVQNRFSERMGEAHERFEHSLKGIILPFNQFFINDGKMTTSGAATRTMKNR